MRIGRWRRCSWKGGEAGEKGRIGEYEEGGGIESTYGRLTWLTNWRTCLLAVCPHPAFKQAVVCKEGRQILTNLCHLANFKSSRSLHFPVEFPKLCVGALDYNILNSFKLLSRNSSRNKPMQLHQSSKIAINLEPVIPF